MKRLILVCFSVLYLFITFSSCKADDPATSGDKSMQNNGEVKDTMSNQMRVKIGSKSFTAALQDNATVKAFKAMLPMTLDMNELNGNEKYSPLASSLSTDASNPGTIHAGDLMIWGSNTLVLFYKTFSTSYSYMRLGNIKDTAGLAAAAGSGNVTVTFELE